MAITDAYSAISPRATGKITCGGWLVAGKNGNEEGNTVQRHALWRRAQTAQPRGVWR